MLIFVSDLHLGDGTCAMTLSADAFRIFRDRLTLLMQTASVRRDGKYRPIEEVDLVLLGDIFEVLHSELWLQEEPGEPSYARPWSDSTSVELGSKILAITRAILENNSASLKILRQMAQGRGIRLQPANRRGLPALNTKESVPVRVKIHYMVGNHDWEYHLPGALYDQARQEIIDTVGLQNSPAPFPYELSDSPALQELLGRYRIFARHGDYFDRLNFNRAKGRNAATLGDAMGMELFNRFPLEVERRMGDGMPKDFYRMLHEITNIRPSLAVPLWISAQLRQYGGDQERMAQVKAIWDELATAFLALDFVRAHDRKSNPFDSVDGLEALVKFTRLASFQSINQLVTLMQKKVWKDDITLTKHAMKEEAFKTRQAEYIVYGHTHHHEIVPLDTYMVGNERIFQMLVNTGTWRAYHDLARYHPEAQKFVPYQVMSYLTFYQEDERRGRRYEAWSGKLV
ncbi:MAG: hypothetical protein JW726_07935 [Anaerolineales bacterium]|nr:hypothetical protein [Anaerolineales bacterium]